MKPLYTSTLIRQAIACVLATSLVACDGHISDDQNDHQNASPKASSHGDPARPGGQATVNAIGVNAFSLPSANMSPSRRVNFTVGNSFFRNPWVIAPSSTTARDGLGPLFNTNACQNCHIKDGRGHPPSTPDDTSVSMLVRLSIPATAGDEALLEKFGVVTEPTYGEQLQIMAIPGHQPEGRARVEYSEESVTLADGTLVSLRRPKLTVTDLNYGPLHPDTLFSARIAPPMIGLGLLEAIPETDLLAHEDSEDRNQDGISGKANRVWNRETQSTSLGRFGWKAGQATLNLQNSAAFAGDMGLTSTLNTHDDCTDKQKDCKNAPNGNDANGHEVSDKILANVLFYSRNLAVPARRNMDDTDVRKGENLFHEAGCAKCHIPSYVTRTDAAEPELANQVIFPYTDLLLHDMGEGLADNRPEYLASGSEWRTPPLWGIGLTQSVNGHTQFLHDGRARNVLEAILWHDGEAKAAKNHVVHMSKSEREALIKFIESL